MLESMAVVLERPGRLTLSPLEIDQPQPADVVVETQWTGVSGGTERLLFTGRMPSFPGMGYPLVPGYETVGRVVEAGALSGVAVGASVFVPGAKCYGAVRALHGGAASRLVVPGARVIPISNSVGERGVLFALAATALHAVAASPACTAPLVVGHGVVGRLIARLLLARGGDAPVVWEANPKRAGGAEGYRVVAPEADEGARYGTIFDASGDSGILDSLIQHLAPGGEVVLAGFYDRPSFSFPPAFMREARIRISAAWGEGDLARVATMVEEGRLSLDGLITHRRSASNAPEAYAAAFDDPDCVKMVLDWRSFS